MGARICCRGFGMECLDVDSLSGSSCLTVYLCESMRHIHLLPCWTKDPTSSAYAWAENSFMWSSLLQSVCSGPVIWFSLSGQLCHLRLPQSSYLISQDGKKTLGDGLLNRSFHVCWFWGARSHIKFDIDCDCTRSKVCPPLISCSWTKALVQLGAV